MVLVFNITLLLGLLWLVAELLVAMEQIWDQVPLIKSSHICSISQAGRWYQFGCMSCMNNSNMFQINYIYSIPSSAEGYFSAKEEGYLRSDELKMGQTISLQSVILPFVKQSQSKVRWEGLGVHI